MKNIDFEIIICLMPYWAAEIRHLGQIFPMEPDLFDLVVVDESSQVNIAEVVPAFYRAKHICIVGDHKQLSLNSTGINFTLNKSYDTLTWNKYKCNNLLYENAKKAKLTVLDASILDFIMKDSRILIPTIMLDEHFRSMPAMADYTNKYYDGKLKIM
ncbi:MAG: ATP-binding protein [Nitrospirae bacterium]|nr:ATP-binding protein [Nitrospirota bacterium]